MGGRRPRRGRGLDPLGEAVEVGLHGVGRPGRAVRAGADGARGARPAEPALVRRSGAPRATRDRPTPRRRPTGSARARRRPRVGGPQDPARPADRPGPQPQGARRQAGQEGRARRDRRPGCSTGSRRSGWSTTRRSPGRGSPVAAAGQGAGPPGAGPGAAAQGHRRRGGPRGARRDRPGRRGGRGPRAGAQKLRSLQRVDEQTATRRLVGMLARKGYGAGLAFAVVRDELRRDGEDELEMDADLDDESWARSMPDLQPVDAELVRRLQRARGRLRGHRQPAPTPTGPVAAPADESSPDNYLLLGAPSEAYPGGADVRQRQARQRATSATT